MSRGTYCGGRNSGRSNGNNSRNRNKNNGENNNISKEKEELKFQPHYAGQNQTGSTYSTIKDHILNEIQKSYKYGFDIAKALRLEEDKGTRAPEPERILVNEEITDSNATIMKIKQDG